MSFVETFLRRRTDSLSPFPAGSLAKLQRTYSMSMRCGTFGRGSPPANNRDNEHPFAGGPSTGAAGYSLDGGRTSDFSCILVSLDHREQREMANYLDMKCLIHLYHLLEYNLSFILTCTSCNELHWDVSIGDTVILCLKFLNE